MPRVRHDLRHDRKASVLFAVLVVISLLTLAAFQFSDMLEQENVAAHSALRQTQARALADSGIHYAAALLADEASVTGTLGDNTYENESAFKQVEISGAKGSFSIVAAIPRDEQVSTQSFRYGVTDESGRININGLVASGVAKQTIHNILMKLPNMTDEIADAIIDWIDTDDTAQPAGAESSYYSSSTPSYRCKNGPLESVEELLLVKGVTAPLLFGTDRNRNGIEDSGEDDGDGWDPGWAAYLTVYSRTRNVDADGNPRFNLNATISQEYYDNLKTAVGQTLADFIVVASQSSVQATAEDYTKSDGDVVQSVIQTLIKNGSARASFTSGWDLLGKTVTISVPAPPRPPGQFGPAPRPRNVTVRNPLDDSGQQATLLPTLLDKTTTKAGAELPARINVLTAPKEVLTCLTGLGVQGGITDADIQTILEARPSLSNGNPTEEIYKTTAWLYIEAKIQPRTMAALETYIGSRTQVYRVQSVGSLNQGGPTARIEAVIDTNDGKPRILMWRDLSELGKGYNLSQ